MHRVTGSAALALCLLTAAGLGSCATVTGTLAGPVTGPLHLDDNGLVATPAWFRPIAYVVAVPMGLFTGFATGVAADWGCVVSGFEYGAEGHPPFAAVWNPMAPWGGSSLWREPGQAAVAVDAR